METKKIAVVTGGGDGIGADITRRMVRDGFAVAILDIGMEKAEELERELRAQGADAVAIACDVSQQQDVGAAFDQIMKVYGRIDVLVNNAGVGGYLPWMEASLEDWRRMYAVNCDGVFLCVQRAAKEMVATDIRGKIIITLSQASFTQDEDAVLYAASKWGARGFMRNAALALAPYGITVNGVCPGTVWTPMMDGFCEEYVAAGKGTKEEYVKLIEGKYPLGRMQTGDDIAGMVSFVVREGHHITGQSLLVAGGIAFA